MRAMTLLAIVFLVGTAEAVPITQCGQTVPAGDTGDLMNDLVCGGAMGVTLGDGATVKLNGFSIVGAGPGFTDPNAPSYQGVFAGVFCSAGSNPITGAEVRSCTINGPGQIANHSIGIWARASRIVTVNDVIVSGNLDGIISSSKGTLSFMNVVVNDNTDVGVSAVRRILGINVQVNNNRNGGILGSGLRMTGLTARGNGQYGGVSLLSSPPRSGKLVNSTITANNGLLPHFGGGYDIVAFKRIRLVNTVCGKTARVKPTTLGTPYPYQIVGSFNCIPSPSGAFLD